MNLIPSKMFMDDFFNDLIIKETTNFKCDIYEKDGNYCIELDAPGVKKEDMTLEYNKGYLIIAISSNEEIEDEQKNYIRKERHAREYRREFYIGDIDHNKIEASFSDGVVRIVAPKVDETTSKKMIEIK